MFKWSKRSKSNQKQPSNSEVEITHSFPEYHTPVNVFPAVTSLDASAKL